MRLEARPTPVTLNLAETAVLVVDMQNDFGSEGGIFERAGIDISGIQKAVGETSRMLAAARLVGIPIVYLKILQFRGGRCAEPGTAPQFFGVGEPADRPGGGEKRVLIRDTWGSEIVEALTPAPVDTVLYKTRFSGFYDTELDSVLQRQSVKHLIVTGCTTSVCVESTIRDAFSRDYHCVLLQDCTSEPIAKDAPRSNHDATILLIEIMFGWTSTSEQFLNAVESFPLATNTVAE